MTSGTDLSSGGISPDKKRELLKIALTALVSAISVIFGIEIAVGGI